MSDRGVLRPPHRTVPTHLPNNGVLRGEATGHRQLRDAVVYEQWEGTHNALTAQVLRDLGRLDITKVVIGRTIAILESVTDPSLEAIASRALAGFEELATEVRRSVKVPEHGAMHFRATLEHLRRGHQVALLLDAAQHEDSLGSQLAAAASFLTG